MQFLDKEFEFRDESLLTPDEVYRKWFVDSGSHILKIPSNVEHQIVLSCL
jgi:uncharacterized protein YxjI